MNKICKKGRAWNEDFIYSCKSFSFVIDGATSLIKEKYSSYNTDAEWFAKELYNYLKISLKDFSKSISTIIKEAINNLKEKYIILANGQEIKDMPSACVAIIRNINKDQIDYFVLGDSGFAIKQGNKISNFVMDDIIKLDEIDLKDMIHISKVKKISIDKAQYFIKDQILQKRMTKNTPNGYWILCDDEKACDHALQGLIQIHSGDQILLYSDGFSQLWDTMKVVSLKNIFTALKKDTDVEDLYKLLFSLQESDSLCNTFPRFKKRDDTGAIYLQY